MLWFMRLAVHVQVLGSALQVVLGLDMTIMWFGGAWDLAVISVGVMGLTMVWSGGRSELAGCRWR